MSEHDDADEYPKAGDSLFSGSGNWKLNAFVQYPWPDDPDWGRYCEGYRAAAETLRKRVEEDKSLRDSLVFPIIFLYRHHFELCLKAIVVDGSAVLKQSVTFPKTHDLNELWKRARVVLEQRWGSDPRVDATESLLTEFNLFDAGSYAYRYPVKPDGQTLSHPAKDPTNPKKEFGMVNLDNFCRCADRISRFLGECAYGLWCELAAEDDARVAALGY